MNLSKTILLPLLGMLVILAFIGLSLANNNMYMDKLIVSGLILTAVFIFRMREPK